MHVSKFICDGLSDREIVRKSLEAMDYFVCLYERYENRLLRYIRRVTHTTEEEAADILQESFIKIWKNLNAFDQGLSLSSWVYRIVHNEAVSFLRRKRSFGKDQNAEWDERLFMRYADEASELKAEELEYRDQLTWQLLERLPKPYREVLLLKYLEDMSYEEISDILKIPEGTVAIRINRAKKQFRKLAESDLSHKIV